MATADSVKSKIQNLINQANATTGESDTSLSTAVSRLIENYGQGGGDTGAMIDTLTAGTITEITTNATKTRDYAFYGCKKMKTANLPEATSIGNNAFYQCSVLENLYAPKVTTLGTNVFKSCWVFGYADFPSLTKIGATAFSGAQLFALVLRGSTTCTLSNANAFEGTSIEDPDPSDPEWDGYIYVPSAKVAAYQAATNWSTFSSRFRTLESYTVDGTTTGALDLDKILRGD